MREIRIEDAEFVLKLRTDSKKSQHLSFTEYDIDKQRDFISRYLASLTDYYFIICDYGHEPVGTVRIYDIQGESFCWGSWIISELAPTSAAIESALLVYDYAFFALHYKKSHFDVRKGNTRVVDFHKRFGAKIVGEDAENYFFRYEVESYLETRNRYIRFLP